ncbi:MAG TPA: hypothetical protein VL325_01485 [Pyrinomonadaceae bacterium]|jgi:hypothetical protein|nr:hypothetical protein [Pyrinomonadaceae bacterium]
MSNYDNPLKNVRIASPCSANWDEMYGNERKRFCGDCKLNVYNLSGMSREEAEDLIRNSEGRLCVRFYRRPDGSILTQDCPVGWAKIKQRVSAAATAIFSLLIGLFSGLLFVSVFSKPAPTPTVGVLIPTATPVPTPEYEHVMGAVAYTPTPNPSPTPRVTMGEGVVEIKGKPAI